ncbi:xanthine dehydrogenase family protein molybdopterin-binding subunit [Roseobacter denitrificans]|uniref:Isoquinoline 1-oxidoreductase, beta subunit n=1 Tax=Roseobacter denitrificans (strain ATCC 33942 / OCh 114) TaxID=375451 RepID=Q16DG9_ROSDO|nr:xanthine dehydrogenase family protein molybdopterin-binding subunit [Roseobacter denitrificans]ABG29974.1 isoquinoline 1-oxidoreductase, beta subunit [Roseobacter denitrificans OCh 114]AVL53183.1 xanthine dehydrogenase family protein molybdopterin-binding subunit [Roseobacter denitrificans]SFG39210.1 isoquinoline 1-oxidoreductase, beta subunit [Roseobacter denitrificans OCh 114]
MHAIKPAHSKSNADATGPSRRAFLAGATGLVVAMALPIKGRAQAVATAQAAFAPNAFIRVSPDNIVTVLIKHVEMGQGANTGLAILAAEEMDADWSQIRAEQAPDDPSLYANLAFGVQGTGGSTGLSNSYMTMREAGATARALLIEAAAQTWGIPAGDVSVSAGVVSNDATGQTATFGELAERAATLPMPQDVTLKDPSEFKLIGAEGITRLDAADKARGKSTFSIDVMRDGMQVVTVLHPPKFGAVLASFDATAALDVPGVTAVHQIASGVAVYGADTFAALRGRDALVVQWDETNAETRSSQEIEEEFLKAARSPARVAENIGDVDAAFDQAERSFEAEYIFPYLAHAAMEPLDGVVEWTPDRVDVWSAIQIPTIAAPVFSSTLGVAPEAVSLHTMYAGGSFGHRATATNHFENEMAQVAAAAGPGSYKLQWTREDDMTQGYYRPLTVHRFRGGLDADGNITGWDNTVANQSIMAGTMFEQALMGDGLDRTSYEGSTDLPYALPARRVSWAQMQTGVPVLWWRAVGHTHTAYATETFLDELLIAGGRDPVQGRLDLITQDRPRDRAVLERVAEMAQWSGPGTGERRYGVALHRSFGSFVAQIAEVENRDGTPHVTRVWCALDCGVAVTPDVVRAQMEGGIGFGLSAALFEQLTLEAGGTVRERNFDAYRVLGLEEMPEIMVDIMPSEVAPTGVGEPGTPPIAAAVGNAWRAHTGQTPRRLPIIGA